MHGHCRNLSQPDSRQPTRAYFKDYSFKYTDRIGKGYSSVVYKGINERTNQIVAIKVIEMRTLKDEVSRQMLECQILALKTLNSDNILKCFQVVKQINECYIVTQYCNQGDLSAYMRRKSPLAEKQITPLMIDILSGYIEIADKKFLHRDLKLANIFVNDGRAIIADFGFAKRDTVIATRESYNVGSPLYMSPQALKQNIYTAKNDIWSIGIMAYELFHGKTPWQCKTQSELIDKITRVPVKFNDSIKISSTMKDFIRKCLVVDDTKRMAVNELKHWIQCFSTSFHEQRCGSRASRTSRNSRTSRKQNQQRISILGRPLQLIDNLLTERKSSQIKLKIPSVDYFAVKNIKTNRDTSRNKENRLSLVGNRSTSKHSRERSLQLTKQIVDSNNDILVTEINKYRLLYKLLKKLKTHESNQKLLISYLSSQLVQKVKQVHDYVQDHSKWASKLSKLGLQQIGAYFNESTNKSIGKYKLVSREYYTKYTKEYPVSQNIGFQPPILIRQKLMSICDKYLQHSSSNKADTDLMVYWIIEYAGINTKTTKDYLDNVLEGDEASNREEMRMKMQKIRLSEN